MLARERDEREVWFAYQADREAALPAGGGSAIQPGSACSAVRLAGAARLPGARAVNETQAAYLLANSVECLDGDRAQVKQLSQRRGNGGVYSARLVAAARPRGNIGF